ncbi:MAG: hypothetical protein VX694_14905, partial [Planctomycetota bacterium]|nr:hypothetical protein [Planctomycetota bacterium]
SNNQNFFDVVATWHFGSSSGSNERIKFQGSGQHTLRMAGSTPMQPELPLRRGPNLGTHP